VLSSSAVLVYLQPKSDTAPGATVSVTVTIGTPDRFSDKRSCPGNRTLFLVFVDQNFDPAERPTPHNFAQIIRGGLSSLPRRCWYHAVSYPPGRVLPM